MHGIHKCLATGNHNSILYNFGYKKFLRKVGPLVKIFYEVFERRLDRE